MLKDGLRLVSLSIRLAYVSLLSRWVFERWTMRPLSRIIPSRSVPCCVILSTYLRSIWESLDQLIRLVSMPRNAQLGRGLDYQINLSTFFLLSFTCLAVTIRHSGINLRHVEYFCNYFSSHKHFIFRNTLRIKYPIHYSFKIQHYLT